MNTFFADRALLARFGRLSGEILEALGVEIVRDKSPEASWIYNYYAFSARNCKLLNFDSALRPLNLLNITSARAKWINAPIFVYFIYSLLDKCPSWWVGRAALSLRFNRKIQLASGESVKLRCRRRFKRLLFHSFHSSRPFTSRISVWPTFHKSENILCSILADIKRKWQWKTGNIIARARRKRDILVIQFLHRYVELSIRISIGFFLFFSFFFVQVSLSDWISSNRERKRLLLCFIEMPHQSRDLASVFLWCRSSRPLSLFARDFSDRPTRSDFFHFVLLHSKKRTTHPSLVEIVKPRPAMKEANEAIGKIKKNRGIEITNWCFS